MLILLGPPTGQPAGDRRLIVAQQGTSIATAIILPFPRLDSGQSLFLDLGFHRPGRRSWDQAFGGHVRQLCHIGERALVVGGHDDHVRDSLHDGSHAQDVLACAVGIEVGPQP